MRQSGGKARPSGETAASRLPGAGRSEGEGTGGGPSQRPRPAEAEGRNTEVAYSTGTCRGNALPPPTGTSGASVVDGHLGRWDQSTRGRRAPAWSR